MDKRWTKTFRKQNTDFRSNIDFWREAYPRWAAEPPPFCRWRAARLFREISAVPVSPNDQPGEPSPMAMSGVATGMFKEA